MIFDLEKTIDILHFFSKADKCHHPFLTKTDIYIDPHSQRLLASRKRFLRHTKRLKFKIKPSSDLRIQISFCGLHWVSVASTTMDYFDSFEEPVAMSTPGRKRRVGVSKRNESKRQRYSGEGHVPRVACNHANDSFCVGRNLNDSDISYCSEKLYRTNNKVEQDAILLSYMDISAPKRLCAEESRQKPRKTSVKYFIVLESKEKIPVCKETFMSIFGE